MYENTQSDYSSSTDIRNDFTSSDYTDFYDESSINKKAVGWATYCQENNIIVEDDSDDKIWAFYLYHMF